jgi:uncharacterized protein
MGQQILDAGPIAGAPPLEQTAGATVRIPRYSPGRILAVWAAATIPMGVLAWVVAPRLASTLTGAAPLVRSLLALLTLGLVWQFILVAILVRREQGTFRWSVVKEALWLRRPTSPRSGRVGGRVWLLTIPLMLLFAAEPLIPTLSHPANRDLGMFLSSDAGQGFMSGNWAWFGVAIVLMIFNTVLGEELLFRGFLLPRMGGAFGRADWLANGVLFSLYHVATWWVMPSTVIDAFTLAYPTKRYRSAWMGIVVHSAQSVFLALMMLALVLR